MANTWIGNEDIFEGVVALSKRITVVLQISDLLDEKCDGCNTRYELNKKYGGFTAKLDGYCNRECPVGQALQALGKELTVNLRKKCDEEIA